MKNPPPPTKFTNQNPVTPFLQVLDPPLYAYNFSTETALIDATEYIINAFNCWDDAGMRIMDYLLIQGVFTLSYSLALKFTVILSTPFLGDKSCQKPALFVC